jgi:hypothetical protein
MGCRELRDWGGKVQGEKAWLAGLAELAELEKQRADQCCSRSGSGAAFMLGRLGRLLPRSTPARPLPSGLHCWVCDGKCGYWRLF